MFSEVDNWFYRYVGGIKYTDDSLVINPIYLENVNKINEYSFEQIQFDLLIEDFKSTDADEYLRIKQFLSDFDEFLRNLDIKPSCDKNSFNESLETDLDNIFD